MDRFFVAFWKFLPPKMEPVIFKIRQKVASETPSKISLIFDRCLIDLWRPRPSKTCLPPRRDANLHKMVCSRKLTKKLPKASQHPSKNEPRITKTPLRKLIEKSIPSRNAFSQKRASKMSSKRYEGRSVSGFFFRHRFGYQKTRFRNRFRKGLGLVFGVVFVDLWTFLVATCREYVPTLSLFHLPFPILSTHTGTRNKNLA